MLTLLTSAHVPLPLPPGVQLALDVLDCTGAAFGGGEWGGGLPNHLFLSYLLSLSEFSSQHTSILEPGKAFHLVGLCLFLHSSDYRCQSNAEDPSQG